MNNDQVTILANTVTETVLDFLASKHNTTARVIAELVQAGHENISCQFYQLMAVGVREALIHAVTINT